MNPHSFIVQHDHTSVINKYKSINGLGYYTYTRLFQSAVWPMLDYLSEIWGCKQFPQIDAIQNKAIIISFRNSQICVY